VTANLAVAYPPPIAGLVNVGLLHTSVQGYDGHDPYAPCSLADLTGRGYEYFALGHVHAREILSTGPQTVAFSGNLQGRHPRETGPKGALEVQLRPGGEAVVEFVPLDVARWEMIEVDVTGADDPASVYGRVESTVAEVRESAEERAVVARVRLTGTSESAGELADADRLGYEIRPAAARHKVAIDKIISQVTTPRERRHLPPSQREVFDAVLDRILDDPSVLLSDPEVMSDLTALTSEVNVRYLRGVGADISDQGQLDELVRQAAHRLREKAEGGLL
jgi:DNA repair exonuclease SbcCD nuclease subunit